MTKLSIAARKGDTKVEVDSTDYVESEKLCFLENERRRWVIDKGSLVISISVGKRLPGRGRLRAHWLRTSSSKPKVIVSVSIDEVNEDEIHFVCYVDVLERADPADDAQDRACAEDLEARIQRIMMPERPHERQVLVAAVSWFLPCRQHKNGGQPPRARAMGLPAFGHGTSGDVHREGAGEAEARPTRIWRAGRWWSDPLATLYEGQTGR